MQRAMGRNWAKSARWANAEIPIRMGEKEKEKPIGTRLHMPNGPKRFRE
jgi:hypothetical protein